MSAKEQDRQDACGTDNNEDSDASNRPSPLATRPDIPISSTGGGGWSVRHWSILLTIAGLAALLGVAIWLRWQVVQQSNLYIDEFTTLWAARRVQAVGAPITPSDVLYTRGILATYAAAAFTAFGGPLHVMGRLPSVLFGLLSIVAVFFVGQREWNARVGWLAALGLVLLPDSIVWASRARFYAQLMFFVLLTVWCAYVIARSDAGARTSRKFFDRPHALFATFFALAVFAQEETVLIYPSLVLALLLWRGPRYFLSRTALTAQALCIGAMALRFLMEQFGQPGYFEATQIHNPYLSLQTDVAGHWAAYERMIVGPQRLLWTLSGATGILAALVNLVAVRWRPRALPRFHQATLFFALQFIILLLILVTLVGQKWQGSRYLVMGLPFWVLVVFAGAVLLVERVTSKVAWQWVFTGGLALLFVVSMWPFTLNAIGNRADGYRPVLEYVGANRQSGDIVMSPQPPACALVLGPCDYYATQRSFEEYVIERDGVWVDRWSGAKLLNTVEQLETVIRESPRVWFVADVERLARRYDDDFARMLIEQFDIAYQQDEVLALRAEGWREQPARPIQKSLDPPVEMGPLALLGWERNTVVPDERLSVVLSWEGMEVADRKFNTSLQVVASDGARIAQRDGALARGMISTDVESKVTIPDFKNVTLPVDLAPGRYRIDVVVYDVPTLTPLSAPLPLDWFRIGPPPALPQQKSNAVWQNGIVLVGHDDLPTSLAPGQSLPLRLVWQRSITAETIGDYTVFAHLVGPDGAIVAQNDHIPENGFYPTSAWEPDDPVADRFELALPDTLPPGEYRLVAGLYDSVTGQRLLLTNGADAVELGKWQQ